jgi:branched-chain amino acid aminotransferase
MAKKKGTHTYVDDPRNESILIYVDGQIVPRLKAKVSVFDSGFLLGDGVWEGIRLHNGNLCFQEEHIKRLFQGVEALQIEIRESPLELVDLIHDTLEANNMKSDVHIRLIVSRGLKRTPYQHPNANVGRPTIVVIPEYKRVDIALINKGIRLCTVDTIRGPQNVQDPRLNTLSKLNCIAACLEADVKGYDEGLMLDINGYVATCNSTNFFIVKNGEIWTSTGKFCLPGVTRGNIIKLCKENHIPIFEKDFKIEDVHSADEVFVTGTFAGVIPGVEVDNHIINNGQRGELTVQLFNLYKQKIQDLYG